MRVHCVLSIALILMTAPTVHAAEPSTPRPNVLFIVVDDLNTELGCYGNPIVKSPNVDRLAARGVRFDRAYCQYPLCNPSRTSFLSGRRPESTGVYVLPTPPRQAMPDAVMLPQLFRQNGYFTAGAGKVYHSLKTNDPKSWDAYEDGPGDDPGEKAAIQDRYGGGDGTPKAYILDTDGSKARDGTNARTIAARLADHAKSAKPFFLAAGFHKPHLPWTAPRKFFQMYENKVPEPTEPAMQNVPQVALQTELSGFAQPKSRTAAIAGYYACVSFMDENLGLLLDEMDRGKLWDKTVVVLLGDNGWHLGDHDGLWSKLSAFESATRVPLIMAGAGIPQGKIIKEPVELLDVYPTVAELCSLTAPPNLQGKSLVPWMNGQVPAGAKAFSMVYHYDVTKGIDILGRTVKTSSFRYTEWANEKKDRELYIGNDPTSDYANEAESGNYTEQRSQGEKLLTELKSPKPGPANRPRALVKEK